MVMASPGHINVPPDLVPQLMAKVEELADILRKGVRDKLVELPYETSEVSDELFAAEVEKAAGADLDWPWYLVVHTEGRRILRRYERLRPGVLAEWFLQDVALALAERQAAAPHYRDFMLPEALRVVRQSTEGKPSPTSRRRWWSLPSKGRGQSE